MSEVNDYEKFRTVLAMNLFNVLDEEQLPNVMEAIDDCNGLFVSIRKPYHQIKAHALELIIKKISKRTGIKAYPHKLRHTFATHGIRSGMPLEKLQILLGHSNPKTTLIYVEQNKEDIQSVYSKSYV